MKPVDHMPPGEWTLTQVFVHVTKVFGGDWALAVSDMNRALASEHVRAMVRPRTDISRGHELPVEFWQTHRLSSDGPGHIIVRSKEYPSNDYRYFLRQSDTEKAWPVVALATDEISSTWWRKSSAGAKTEYDWEKILIKAAVYMYENGVPKSLAALCRHIEGLLGDDAPKQTQLEAKLGPLYRAFKKADDK